MSNHQSNQYARNDDQSRTQDHAIIYIEDILRGVPPTWPEHSIFRVPHGLRIANEKAYEPKILAVGPYHYRSDRCKFMEKQKLRYVQRLLERRDEGSVHRFMPILRKMEQQARDCYAETIHLSQNEFLAMMLIDGCFIVQFLREYSIVINGMNDPQMEADGIPFLSSLQRDLLLLENQLPLFVLNKLYDMTRGPKEHPELVDIAISYFSGQPVDLNTNASLRNSKHLLHLMHTYWTFGLPNAHQLIGSTAPTQERLMLKSSATELRDAGVRLRAAAQEQHFMDIKFENGILEIPVFTAEDCAESQFRNLIAYEQLHQCGDISYVTEYILFMDSLINTSKDVELLRRQGIIRNYLGDDEAVAQMFNKMGDCVTLNDSYYNETSRKVNAYCNKKWNVWMAKLRSEYFHSPWALLSVLAAIVLLLLTAAQTAFALLSYKNQS